jgi:hypothetical protein
MRVSTLCGSWTSGVFQRLMTEAFPEIDVLDVGRLLPRICLYVPLQIGRQVVRAFTLRSRTFRKRGALYDHNVWRRM